MVDPGRVRALLDRLAEETGRLRRLAEVPDEDPDRMAAVKYRFVVAIETCIDVAHHIAASEELRVPNDFADTFAVPGEAGFLRGELVPALQRMARFRNLLGHGYLKVDDRKVLEILRTRLGDFDEFRAEIARSLAG